MNDFDYCVGLRHNDRFRDSESWLSAYRRYLDPPGDNAEERAKNAIDAIAELQGIERALS
jgi:hypothetical protein